MPTQNRSTIVGLATPGLFWLATSVASGQGGIALQAPPSSPAPASSTYSVLLLTSGKVVRGSITGDPSGTKYILRQGGVPISYPASVVQKAGGSTEELYQYLLSRLARRDADERMKLARWCMAEDLPGRAREQLEAIQAMSPGDPDSKRMLDSLAANAERQAQLAQQAAQVDPSVSRTGVEMPRGEAPAELSHQALQKVRRDFGNNNVLPVIFDLQPAQAVSRARTFTQQIHPILQNRCATCHGERYQGEFQLVVAKNRRDMNPDVARANLDATLRLVDPDDLPRSEILSAGLVPHGGNKNAVFRGPNDVEYRVIFEWVRSLRATGPGASPVTRTGYTDTATPPPGDGFAADRPNRATPAEMPATPVAPAPVGGLPPLPGALAAQQPTASNEPPPGAHYKLNADFSGGLPDSAFPVPYAAGGELPEAYKPASAKQTPSAAPALGAPAARPAPKTATPVDANTVLVAPSDDPSQLPGMNQERYPPKASTGKKATASAPDRALLEQLMRKRNGTP